MNPTITPKYRPDIDGLRALAVLLVVGYHAFPTLVPSGFIGVDIFFVISGFLISNIIFDGVLERNFSLTHFYSRRIRRIFPALILVLTSCLLVGWLLLWQNEYQQLAKHTQGAALFISNFLLWLESGYFDAAAEVKPLLHLWSLGIEEQFYLIWPIIVWIIFRFRANALFLIIALAATSFAVNLGLLRTNSVSAFYLPQSRCWELLAGSLLAYLTNAKVASHSSLIQSLQKNWLHNERFCHLTAALGLVLLVLSVLLINQTKVFPGYWALLPIMSAVCLIHSGQTSNLNAFIFKNPISVWFGLISFPLYLWHWPLLTFARIAQSDTPDWTIRLCLVMVSILLAWITYQGIEKRFRKEAQVRAKVIALLGAMLCLGVLGTLIIMDKGVSTRPVELNGQRLKATATDGGIGIAMSDQCGLAKENIPDVYHCLSDPRETPNFAMIGDSKALALLPGLIRTSAHMGRWLSINGVTPAFSDSPIKDRDEKALALSIQALNNNKDIKVVAIVNGARTLLTPRGYNEDALMRASNFDAVLTEIDRSIQQLVTGGKKLILVLDNPTLANPEDCLVRDTGFKWLNQAITKINTRCSVSIARHAEITARYRDLFEGLKHKYPGAISIFDTAPFVCDVASERCTTFKDGRLMYSYTDHISDYAAGLIGQGLNALAQKLIQQGPTSR
jgi:peptidoglycan/LPS O-acetylase OafA/YrhL